MDLLSDDQPEGSLSGLSRSATFCNGCYLPHTDRAGLWDMLPLMRLALVLAIWGCGYSHGTPIDANGDGADVPDDRVITWTVDAMSQKATPASAAEWSDFIAAHQLTMSPPQGLWLMQDTAGLLNDAIGTVDLASFGTPAYQQAVPGWTRRAIATTDGEYEGFQNQTNTSLPDVAVTSMTILLYYSTDAMPPAQRSVLFGGCCFGYAEVDLTAGTQLVFKTNQATTSGSVSHGAGTIPILMKHDIAHSRQVVFTDKDLVAAPFTPLMTNRGLFIGGANRPSANARWLYLAAWYGAPAELSDSQVQALLTALGW